jgi:hypothetical protein
VSQTDQFFNDRSVAIFTPEVNVTKLSIFVKDAPANKASVYCVQTVFA